MSPGPRKKKSVPKESSSVKNADAPLEVQTPQDSAQEAGLRYVTDTKPGLHRLRSGKAFRYVDAAGKAVKDKGTLARIKALVIPPAWTDVWICAQANGHLQCTGRDARGRKQSRYHSKWREARDGNKYERMVHFADALPLIRERVASDLRKQGLPKEKVLAAIVGTMEQTHIRVGNEEYAKENQSYGLTTLRNKHVEVHGSHVTFSFQGKSRVHHTVDLQDAKLAKVIRSCEELPGYELFQYVDEEGDPRSIDSSDVNAYLQDITGQHFTAKDFRTWAGTVLACDLLRAMDPFETASQAKKNVVAAVKAVAEKLGNTPSVCRKAYIHPAVLEAYLGGLDKAEAKKELDRKIADKRHALHEEERALLDLLAQRRLLAAAA